MAKVPPPVTEADWKLYEKGEWPPKAVKKTPAKPKPSKPEPSAPPPRPATPKTAAEDAVAAAVEQEELPEADQVAKPLESVEPPAEPLTERALDLARILDDPDAIAEQASAARELTETMQQLRAAANEDIEDVEEPVAPPKPAKKSAGIKGVEEPRIYTPPRRELTEDTTDGYAAIAFAEQMLNMNLFPWQKWLLIHALELNEDFTYRFRTVIMNAARQQGKTTIMIILALWHLYCKGSRTIIATAQDLSKAEDAWAQAVEYAQGDEELQEMIRKISLAHPKLLTVLNPITEKLCSYRVASKSRGGGRGYSGDLVLLDELREHQSWDTWGAVTKDLANSTPILKADGTWTTIGELKPGEQIFSPSGKPTTVLAVHPVSELRPMYRVTSSDRRSVIASSSHLWCVKDARNLARRLRQDKTREWEIFTTEQLLSKGLRLGQAGRRFRLPQQHELVDLPIRDLPLDPYILGAWLGDGNSDGGEIAVGLDYLDEMTAQLQAAGATVFSVRRETSAFKVRLHVNGRPLVSLLREMNLLDNKHVPAVYETASTEQRLALLQGLLDTDGCAIAPRKTARGARACKARFSNGNEGLVDTALFLARSFGWNAWKRETLSMCGEKICGPHWEVDFLVPAGGHIPFRLPRKITNLTSDYARRPRLHVSIDSIEPVVSEPSTCIAVDSDDQLFLAGRDLIPTHNTQMARPNAQAWAFTNAGDAMSVVWRYQRAAAHRELGWPDGDQDAAVLGDADQDIANLFVELEKEFGEDFQVGWFEWSARPDAKRTDRQAWAQSNCSMNHTDVVADCVTERAIAHALRTDPVSVFDQEVMCRFVAFSDGGGPFPEGAWRATVADEDTAMPKPGARSAVCVEVSTTRSASVIAIAALNDDGHPVVGIDEMLAGTDWVLEWLKNNRSRYSGIVVRSGSGSPVLPLLQEIEEAGLPVIEWKTAEVGAGFLQLYDRVVQRTIHHLSHQGLDSAACSAETKPQSAGGWIVDPLKSPGDTSPLYAVTGAVWGLSQLPDDGPSIYSGDSGVQVLSF